MPEFFTFFTFEESRIVLRVSGTPCVALVYQLADRVRLWCRKNWPPL